MADHSADRLIRVDMTDQSISIEAYPEEWKLLGGRALSARILLEECDPKCDPLGPNNVFVLAPGVLAGTVDRKAVEIDARIDGVHILNVAIK